ncbi:MAG: hypothetical protein FWC47_01710 [Oscillospiraceae bacterium]|nr:hypothetical protein [Oscillospiraceae bacterium]
MDAYGKIIILAVLGEAIVENLKVVYEDGKFKKDRIFALFICCMVTTFARCDIFEIVGISFLLPVVGQLFTGILISRGAGAVHDLLKLLEKK